MNRLTNTISLILLLCIPTASHLHACYIDLSKDAIERYVDSTIAFHPHHWPQEEHHNQISFPVLFCYSISLEITGDTRWFFTSAIEGPTPHFGEAIDVTNVSITHVYLVRSEMQKNNWFYVYLGIDGNNPKFSNATHTVYQGDPLCIVRQKALYMVHNDIKYLDTATMDIEVKRYLFDPQNKCDYQNRPFQDASIDAFRQCFLQKRGSFFMNNRLLSSAPLWTQSESLRKKNT